MRKRHITRRQFLGTSAATGIGLLVLPKASLARTFAANEKVNVALCGVGGRGLWFVRTMPKLSNVVAYCDVDEYKAKSAYDAAPKLPKFADFRVMLDKMNKEIDAVVVATTDFSHAAISAAAIRAGKGVFTEKPLTHTVYEARRLRDLAREHKVATQCGNQGSSGHDFRRALQYIRQGVIGVIREAYVWNSGGGSPGRPRIRKDVPQPATLHWDLWLGPRKSRPYSTLWFPQWRTWREFGTNTLGWWAPHSANLPFMSLRMDSLWADGLDPAPRIRVTGFASSVETERFPAWHRVEYEIPARGDLPPVKLHWYGGAGNPSTALIDKARELGMKDEGKSGNVPDFAGCLIIGDKGAIHATGHNMSFELLPKARFKDATLPEKDFENPRGHEREWLHAVKGGKPAWSNFDYSGPLTELLMLGNVASQLPKQTLEFDTGACKIVNNDKADGLLRRDRREGWEL